MEDFDLSCARWHLEGKKEVGLLPGENLTRDLDLDLDLALESGIALKSIIAVGTTFPEVVRYRSILWKAKLLYIRLPVAAANRQLK